MELVEFFSEMMKEIFPENNQVGNTRSFGVRLDVQMR